MKELLPFIMNGTDNNTVFFDCFGGGMNVISEIPSKNKVACDTNYYIVDLWTKIRDNGLDSLELPKNSDELTFAPYEDIRQSYLNNDNRYCDYLIGFVGSACSYGGAWFNGYAHFNPNKNEDHIKEAYNGLKKQVETFKYLDSTAFWWRSYHDLGNEIKIPENSVLFCDPPYMGTKKYESDFDHFVFWHWVRQRSIDGYKVLVTEYNAPDDFKCIWQAKKKDGMGTTKTGNKQNTKIEKLFVLNP